MSMLIDAWQTYTIYVIYNIDVYLCSYFKLQSPVKSQVNVYVSSK